MASRYSNNGRTHPVGRSKSPISSRPSSKKKKTTSVKKFTSAKAISRDDDETMLSMLSAYTNSINRFEGSPRSKSPGREDPNDRLILLKSQLTDALEENAFVKSRLNAELKERHLMEAKYKELNKKFTESKKALQATGAALLQVHNQTSEMKNKRDEREIQLDEALSLNRNLNSKIAELESRLEQALLSNNTGTTTANLKKLIEDKENLIKSMEEQQVQLQSQMSKIRRDNYRLGEENAELQEALESKNRKIANLVKKVGVLEEELEAVGEVRRQISSRGRVMSPGGQASSGREHRVDAKQLENRLNNFEGDKKFLEERMAQLELSLKQSESVIQQIQGASQENSPAKAPQGSQPSLAFSYVSSGAGAYAAAAPSSAAPPPMTEKPSAPSPRKSPGVGSRPSIKASAGTNLLTPIPVESPLESSPPVHAKETPLQKHNALPSLGQATTSNGMLTDALFSSSSVVEVNKVPNAVLDKPASIPSAPMDIASPASSVSSKRSKRKKSSKERSEKSSSSSSASATALATAAITAATVATVAAAPVTTSAAASLPTADVSLSSPKHMATVTPSVQAPVEPVAPAPAAAPTPAPVPAAIKPDPAPETATTTAPEPVVAPAPVPVIVPTPTTEPTAVPTPVAASEPRTTTPAPVANQVPVVSDAPISGTSAPTSKNGSRSNSIRAPISREGRGTPSTANRRPASSKKTTEGTADPAGASALTVEFGPSETIAGRYTEEGVDEMLKPDADAEVFKLRMLELRKRVKRDIYAWTKSFVNETQRQPNKQERKDVGGPMFKAYSGSQKILKDMGVDVTTESSKLGRGTSVKFE